MKKIYNDLSIHKFTLFLTIIAILITFSLMLRSIYADTATGLIVSPPSFISELIPNSTRTQDFIVTNHRGQTENIIVSSREIGINENGEYFIPQGFEQDMTSRLEKAGHMTISPKTFTLNDNESQTVTVTFLLPDNYDTNGYYLELAFQSEPSNPTNAKIAIAPEVIIPIAINFKGVTPQNRKLGIIEFKQTGKPEEKHEAVILRGFSNTIESAVQLLTFDSKTQVSQYMPIKFTSLIKNEGNTNVIPKGEIFISKDKDFKELIATVPLSGSSEDNNNGRIVFAGSSRIFESYWKDGFIEQDEDGKVNYNFDILDKIRVGKYYAQLTVTWDEEMGINYKTEAISFWIIPWKEITAMTLSTIGLGYLLSKLLPNLLLRFKKSA